MPHSEEEPHCQKFEPNIFDSSRCHSCLRVRKQHFGAPVQEDSGGLSVVTGYCDVTRDRLGYEDGSLCILSPDCALYVCDEENSSTSTQDHSDYPELSGSITSEEDYLQLQDTEPHPAMTRLDPPLHRPRPTAWMDEPRGREGFSRSSGSREDRERESGYFSLGRASGVRSLRDMSPSPPFRHTEVGRPLPSTRSPEPKATIPFRNPDLGVPSQRRSLDIEGSDSLPAGSDLPVSHRCLSPTPFKVAESLDSPIRKRVDSSYSASHQTTSRHLSQTGRSSSVQRGGPSPSRSSSPTRGTSPFRRTESAGSSHRQNFDSTPFTQRSTQRSGSPSQNSYGRDADSRGLRGNLKSAVSMVASRVQSSSFEHLKNSVNVTSARGFSIRHKRSASPVREGYGSPNQTLVHKTETDACTNGISRDSHSTSPSRRSYDPPGHSLQRKIETNASTNSPGRGSRSSSPSRRSYSQPSQSLPQKTETNNSYNNRGRDSRSSSISRRSYDTPSQSLLRKTETNLSTNNRGLNSRNSSPSRRSYDQPSQSLLRKTETNSSYNKRGPDSRSCSPSRRSYDMSSQSLLRKTETNLSSNNRGHNSRNSSPSRRSYDQTSQSLLRKTETKGTYNNRGHDSRSSSPSRRSNDVPSQSLLRKTENNVSTNRRGCDSRTSSPSRRGYDTSQSRKSTNSDARSSESSFLRSATSVAKADSNPAYLRKTNHKDARSDVSTSPGSWRGSALSLRSPPTSRSSSPAGRDKGPKVPSNTLKFVGRSTNESSSRTKTGHSRPGLEPRSPSPEYCRSSSRTRSPSPQRRRHESSQSSLSESESSHISAGSAAVGFNREEYALMADLPKVKTIFQREGAGQQERGLSSSPVRDERYKPASHSREKPRYWDRDESGERGRERRDGQEAAVGFVQSHYTASVHTPVTLTEERRDIGNNILPD